MSEQKTEAQQTPEQLSDILLVLDKDKKKIQAVTGIGKDGNLETTEPTKENNNKFMKVDKHGDFFSNFLSNFLSQLKDPTKFKFFKVPAPIAVDVVNKMQKQVDNPTPDSEKLMKEFEVKTAPEKEQKQKNNDNMDTMQTTPKTGEYRYKPEQIDWETMNNLGLGKERLEKMNLLDPLLRGYKTNELVPISVNLGSAVTRMDARLSLQAGADGTTVVVIHGIRKEPNLNFEFFGHKFTDEDKKNLLEKGNMGRVVDLKNTKTGAMMPSIVSLDRLTNELVALRTDFIKIPDEIKGVKLDDAQKQTLMEGKPLYLEGMTSKKGEPFSANVQYNADKRYVEFLFDRNRQAQTNRQAKQPGQPQEASRTFRGKELDEEQYNKFKAGQTVYIDGLLDKKGQKYQGYITLNKETGKTDFSFKNPNKLKELAKPVEAHKTQTAVNSEGKTNEATKNIKEPLQPKQQTPKNKMQQGKQEKPKAPAKSRGRKM